MKANEKIPCGACESGHYEEVIKRYETKAAGDVEIVLPKVKILRCPACGDELIPPETQEQIDRAIAEQTEQLSQRELEDIAECFGLDQTEASEVLGLGSKTFHRWLKGTQFPSRSMGYYLRVLAQFPEAFDWLRERGWRKRNRVTTIGVGNVAIQFPDLQWLRGQSRPSVRPELFEPDPQEHFRFNPAALIKETKVK